jgi:transposase
MMGKALPLRSDLSADALRAQARQEKKGRVVARMLAIAHALDGVGRAQAARLAGLDRQALRDTVIRYNAEGVFHDRRSPGRPPWLSLDERAALKEVILARWNGTAAWNGRCRCCARR